MITSTVSLRSTGPEKTIQMSITYPLDLSNVTVISTYTIIAEMCSVPIVAVTGWDGEPFWSWKPENTIRVAKQHGDNGAEAETTALRALSLARRRQRKLPEALSVQQEALEKLRDLASMLRPLDDQALRAEAELATIYRDSGNLEEALTLQSTVVERARRYFGECSLETLHEMSCLGILAKKTDDLQKALSIEAEVLRLYKEYFPDRLEMWNAMSSLAITYYYLDRNDEAIDLELQVLDAKTTQAVRPGPPRGSFSHAEPCNDLQGHW